MKKSLCLILILTFKLNLFNISRALAEELDQSSRVNEHIVGTHNDLQKRRIEAESLNFYAPAIDKNAEFNSPSTDGSYGVDMRFAPTVQSFEYDKTYKPKSMDATVEAEIYDRQTTDFVVEKQWREIKQGINREVNSVSTPTMPARPLPQ